MPYSDRTDFSGECNFNLVVEEGDLPVIGDSQKCSKYGYIMSQGLL